MKVNSKFRAEAAEYYKNHETFIEERRVLSDAFRQVIEDGECDPFYLRQVRSHVRLQSRRKDFHSVEAENVQPV